MSIYYDIRLPTILADGKDSFASTNRRSQFGIKEHLASIQSIQAATGETFAQIHNRIPILPVFPGGSVEYLKAAERIGVYFRREFGYDSRPHAGRYELPTSALADEENVTYLFYDRAPHHRYYNPHRRAVFGAAGFYWKHWRDAPSGYELSWAWFHPFERRKGHLTRAWPFFIARHGTFTVAQPYSKAMSEFLNRYSLTNDLGRQNGEPK